MKLILFCVQLSLLTSNFAQSNDSLCKYVNPFIGTGGHGHTYPGAVAPFGFMQLSPDTRLDGWDGCGGYHFDDDFIYGFSHTHLSGTGVSDYADILLVPQTGKANTISPMENKKKSYGSHFSHDDEQASPGMYSVFLKDEKIKAELSCDIHSGLHRYTFSAKNKRKYILIDLDYRDELIGADINLIDSNSVSGYRHSKAWANSQKIFFYLESDVKFKKVKKITKNNKHQLLLEFSKEVNIVNLRIGISGVDIDGAKVNLESEINHFDIGKLQKKVQSDWERELGKIQYKTENKDEKIKFYTAFYHTMVVPNQFSDVDGRYRGNDDQIHQLSSDQKQYTVFSLWDTYRAAHPLYTIVDKKRTIDFIQTFLRIYDERGDLPVWELAGNETECMIGYHSVSVIADAYAKNIRDFDFKNALEACIATSNFDEFGKNQFNRENYISYLEEPESVSKTLEYAYDSYCISALLELQGFENRENYKLYQKYLHRSQAFINQYDPESKFMRARNGGLWLNPFSASEVNHHYTEANAWQYSLYVPHALADLTDLIGGKDSLENWLDNLFTQNPATTGREQVDITGLIGQYAHGNEPSHHMAYLYNYTNHPSKAQFYLDKIMNEFYTTKADGLIGNEDCGQMSAWYVLSAMGLYQIAPSIPIYEIGRPMHDETSIFLENEKIFRIVVENNAKENRYLNEIYLNGQKMNTNCISHQQIMSGGILRIIMGNSPNDELKNRNATGETVGNIIPLPYFKVGSQLFTEKLDIDISHPYFGKAGYQIYYSINDSLNDLNKILFTQAFSINETSKIYIGIKNGGRWGQIVSNDFIKLNQDVRIVTNSKYASQYAAEGENALIDGKKGGVSYRSGNWQGYNDQDFETELTFARGTELETLKISFLQDTRSWIFPPESIHYEIIYESGEIKKIDIKNPDLEKTEEILVKEYQISIPAGEIKEIKIKAKNIGSLPKWHISAGYPVWLFVDEIEFN